MADGKSSHLLRLFKRCLYLGDDPSVIEKSLEDLQALKHTDLNDYFDSEVQLAPLLYWHLKQRRLGANVTQDLASNLAKRYQENVARNFLFERSLIGILDRFNRAGIEAIVLKGASVFSSSLAFFRDAFVLLDIDLLVRPAEMRLAAEILTSNGYCLTQESQMDGATKQEFLGADRFTRVDLHSGLFWNSAQFKYLDYFPTDLWKSFITDSIAGYPVKLLSMEDQICFRLAHDALAHETLLLRKVSRLYYFSALVHFYRDGIDWNRLLRTLTKTGNDRLLKAHIYYGHRELGVPVPAELERFRPEAEADVAYLDAVVDASPRLRDYTVRTSFALLTAQNPRTRLRKLVQLMRSSVMPFFRQKDGKRSGPTAPGAFVSMLKRCCLQLAAILYVNAYTLQHSVWRKEHVG